MQRFFRVIFFITLLGFCHSSWAQFFNNGRGSASVRWEQMKASDYRLLYPDYYRPTAARISGFMDSLRPYITYGLDTDLAMTPMVIYPDDQISNGMVTWAPKRGELMTTAPINSTSTPWIEQLFIHEWRHVAQISALRRGTTNVFRALMGQAGMGVGLIVNSSWMLEGDAVNAETQLSEYGRGLQPDFTLEYRALASQGFFDKFSTDRLACGSFKRNIPDHYKYGYQVSTAAETFVSPTIWGEIFAYNASYPMLISPDYFLLKKRYNTSFDVIRHRAFSELVELWTPYQSVAENFEYIDTLTTSYTTFDSPVPWDGGLLALKKDFRTPDHLVYVDSLGLERTLSYTGALSSRAVVLGDVLYLTEYQPDMFYQMQNYSVIRSYDLSSGKWRSYRNRESNYLVTPISDGRFATVKNDSLSRGYIQFYNSDFSQELDSYHFGNATLHGLAWDEFTSSLYFIGVDGSGMWIGALDQDLQFRLIKEPSAVTISDLRAEDGCLVFGSIASGKDEVHILNLRDNLEYQLTDSRFGSGQPIVADSTLYHRSYTSDGWLLAKQTIDTLSQDTVAWSRLPRNILNPKRLKWDVDSIKNTVAQVETPAVKHPTKRFRRAPHLFNFHSWAPVAVDFDGLYHEQNLSFGYGATGFFQSTLSDMEGSLTLGGKNQKFWGLTSFKYTGLPVQFSVRAEYGGANQTVYSSDVEYAQEYLRTNALGSYFSASIEAVLPMNFTSGSSMRLLQPTISLNHYNSLFCEREGLHTGFQKWDASLWWSSVQRAAYQDIVPRLGYSVRAGVSGALNPDFSTMYYLWGRGYLPGFAKTHSVTLIGAMQYQNASKYAFSGKVQMARGVNDPYSAQRYGALSLDYTMPVWYPDGGIDGVLNFKRIFINMFGDYTFGQYFTNVDGQTTALSNHSYGFELGMDINIFRSTDQRIRFMLAFPNSSDLHFGFGYSFGF